MTTYADIVKMWRGFGVNSSEKFAAYLDKFAVQFAYNSGAIENERITYHDTHEIFEHGRVVDYTGDLRTLFEIENSKIAHDLLLRWLNEQQPITQKAIKHMQQALTRGTYNERKWALGERPGHYKKNDIWGVGEHDVAAPVACVEEEMGEIVQQLDGIDDNQALAAAAWFHAKFEAIHAFADGNGRTGRMVMNYILLKHGHPPIIVHERDKKAYYDALDRFDVSGEIDVLKNFLISQAIATWAPTFERQVKTNSAQKEKQLEPSQSRSPKDAARGASASVNTRNKNTPSGRFKGR